MPRPTTKTELIQAAEGGYKKLKDFIEAMPQEEQIAEFLFEDRDKNIRDVLVHLYEWHQLLLNWINHNRKGEKVPFLPEPYNWRTYPAMNVEAIWKKHQNTPYETAKEMLQESHQRVLEIIETFSNEELFTKKYYDWTGTSNVAAYCISVTSSHYDWAMKKIKKQDKEYHTK